MTLESIGRISSAAVFMLFAGAAWGNNPVSHQLNITRIVSTFQPMSYMLNNSALSVCVVIGLLVFCAMAIAMVCFRKSRGAVAMKRAQNIVLEIVWTIVPLIILIVLVYLATGGLTRFTDTRAPRITPISPRV